MKHRIIGYEISVEMDPLYDLLLIRAEYSPGAEPVVHVGLSQIDELVDALNRTKSDLIERKMLAARRRRGGPAGV